MTDGSPLILSSSLGLGDHNPYVDQLTQELLKLGADVRPFNLRHVRAALADAVMIHWPEYALKEPALWPAIAGCARTLIKLAWSRRRGVSVVWTVHNLYAHGGRHPVIEKLFWRMFIPLVSACIYLSPSTEREAKDRFRRLAKLPRALIHHPHYRAIVGAPISKSAARYSLGLSRGRTTIGLVGRLQAYKGIQELLEAFRGAGDPDLRLIIAGAPEDSAMSDLVRSHAASDSRIWIELEPLSSSRLKAIVSALDLVVLPYRRILNSGSALYALSLGRPVLVPESGALADLHDEFGEGWVQVFDLGRLTTEALVAAARSSVLSSGEPEMTGRSWNTAATRTLEFLRSLTRRNYG